MIIIIIITAARAVWSDWRHGGMIDSWTAAAGRRVGEKRSTAWSTVTMTAESADNCCWCRPHNIVPQHWRLRDGREYKGCGGAIGFCLEALRAIRLLWLSIIIRSTAPSSVSPPSAISTSPSLWHISRTFISILIAHLLGRWNIGNEVDNVYSSDSHNDAVSSRRISRGVRCKASASCYTDLIGS